MEFKPFSEIKRWTGTHLVITQKIHGSNAQVYIAKLGTVENIAISQEVPEEVIVGNDVYRVRAGSRERWIFTGKNTDNFGFAQFVKDNAVELVEKLGEGIHYGEWAGPGINSGEGLTEKTLVLFNHARPYPLGLPNRVVLVPVLYDGNPDGVDVMIDSMMDDLQSNGSKLVPGFMRPEGIVIDLNGQRRKKVFKPEDTKWTDPSKTKKDPNEKSVSTDYSHLLQPVRLEKLLSRDETYLREYPKTLSQIVKDYMADLEKEDQLPKDLDLLKATKKNAAGQVFKFIRAIADEKTA